MIDDVIAANPAQVAQFKGGKRTVKAFFVEPGDEALAEL